MECRHPFDPVDVRLELRVFETIGMGTDPKSIKQLLRQEFGGFALPAKVYREGWGHIDLAPISREKREAVAGYALRTLSERIVDFAWWRHVDKHHPERYSADVAALTGAAREILNVVYGRPAHRPDRYFARNTAVAELRRANPDLSFGGLALEFNKSTKTPISAKYVERICARQDESETERLIKFWRPDLEILAVLHRVSAEIRHCEQCPTFEVPPRSPIERKHRKRR